MGRSTSSWPHGRGGPAAERLSEAGINPQNVARAFKDMRGDRQMDDPNAESQYRALERFTVDLTRLAREGKIDPVIGRQDEILRTMEVLSGAPRTTRS